MDPRTIETLMRHANETELRALAAVLRRTNARPAILVTTARSGGRRYVVSQEDEHLLDRLLDLKATALAQAVKHSHHHFGAQWLRGLGCVDECLRTISVCEVTSVKTADRARVWGEPTRTQPRRPGPR